MFLERVAELAKFLTDVERTADELARHLALKTFSVVSPAALYIAEITDDGYVSPVGSFGFEISTFANWSRFPLSMHAPITEAVRQDKCITVVASQEKIQEHSIVNEIGIISSKWEAMMAWPMLPYGVGFALLEKKPSTHHEFDLFLRSVGSVVALHHSKIQRREGLSHRGKNSKRKRESVELTKRQRVIYELLCKGATNAVVAAEIGYSESLVRQETIEIYRILGVNGRKELILAAAES